MKTKLWLKFLTLFSVTAIVPLLIFFGYIIIVTKTNMTGSVVSDLSQRNEKVAEFIKILLREKTNNIIALSKNNIIIEDDGTGEEQLAELEKVKETYQIFDDISLINTRGVTLVSTDYNYRGDWKHKSWYADALAGNIAISDVQVIGLPSKIVMSMAVPVFDNDRKVTKVVVAQINMDDVAALLVPYNFSGSGTHFLVDRFNRIIVSQDKTELFTVAAADYRSGNGRIIRTDPENGELFEIYNRITDQPLYGYDIYWVLATSQKTDFAFAMFYSLERQIGVILAIILGMLLLFIFYFFLAVTGPVANIAKVVAEVSSGHFGKKVAHRWRDELGVLAESVNKMSDNLLENKIRIEADTKRIMEIDKMKTEFVSLASHQLRTPLTAIKLFSEMLSKGEVGKMNAKQKEYVDNVWQSTERMVTLVNDLLNIARLESGRLVVEPTETDIIKLIDEAIEEGRILSKESERKYTFKFSSAFPSLILPIDKTLFRQVIHNLLTNAIKYSKGGENFIDIVLKDSRMGYYILSVKDNGIGIPRDFQDRIFEKFSRADNAMTASAGGTGLGLYVCKMISDYYGGKIWFESEEGKGSTFFVTMPYEGMKAVKGEKGLAT